MISPSELSGELVACSLQFRGITTVARSAEPSTARAMPNLGADVILRLVTLMDGDVDLAELAAARAVAPTVGLVVLSTAGDLRLLGVAPQSLPIGTRILSVRDTPGVATLSEAVVSAARHPLAVQRESGRLALSDGQIDVLRAVAEGLCNEQIAARRSTTAGAVRLLVGRTARALGLPADLSPSQTRAGLSAAYVRLLGAGSRPV